MSELIEIFEYVLLGLACPFVLPFVGKEGDEK